ncbi:phage holin family protein [uncultured Sutterella sp.]|uniref:phage holin family protein n=1 Tax=uncultured Sutterella sp. TaxID=286133 RepID=UPI00266DB3A7|nr:phage holin family protein [uncultured Sutterella sp.]
MPLRQLPEEAVLAICGCFAGFCGALSYLLKIEEGKRFSWSEFALHTTISAVFGLIAYELLSYENFPPQVAGALCGVAGWGGTRLIRIIEIVLPRIVTAIISKKLNIDEEDLKDDNSRSSQ